MNSYFLKAFKGENSWWRYLVVIALVFLATQIGSIPFSIVASAKAISQGIELNASNLVNFKLLGIDENFGLLLMSLPFVAGLAAILLFVKPFHNRSITDTLTGRKKFDFKRLFFSIFIWGILMIISLLISYKMNPGNYVFQFDAKKFLILILVSSVFITMQSSFEEIIFRGYFQQGLAVLTKTLWIPLLITSIIFGLLHISNPEVKEYGVAIMLPQYIMLGLLFGICVVMDEGLEIPIGLHVVNNVLTSLLLTHESSVLQTPALFTVKTVDPVYSLFELMAFSIVFLVIMHKKYGWGSYKKILARISPSQE